MNNDPNVTHKIFSSRIDVPATEYIGQAGRLFYHESTGELRISDGVTPHGKPIYFGTSGTGGGGSSGTGVTLVLYDENGVPVRGPMANALLSVAMGDGAATHAHGSVVQAAGAFTHSGDAQAGSYVARGVSTSGAWINLYLDGASAKFIVPANTAIAFTATIIARRTNTSGSEGAVYELKGGVDRAVSASSTRIIGNPSKTIASEDNPNWDFRPAVDMSTGELQIQAKGENAKTIRWVAHIKTVEVKS